MDYTTEMANPLQPLAAPFARVLPNWLPIDGVALSAVLWWYLTQNTNLPDEQVLMATGLTAATHGLLHGIAAQEQQRVFNYNI